MNAYDSFRDSMTDGEIVSLAEIIPAPTTAAEREIFGKIYARFQEKGFYGAIDRGPRQPVGPGTPASIESSSALRIAAMKGEMDRERESRGAAGM